MAEIKQIKGSPVLDYMSRDYDSFVKTMRELVPSKLPEWTDYGSEADFGNVLLELFAHMGDILSYYQDRVANESFLGTAQQRRSIIHHLRLIGYRLATAAPASASLSIRFPATCNDVVTITRGDAFATKSSKDRTSVRFEYTGEDLTIDCSTLNVETDTDNKQYKEQIINVEEGRLIKEDILGVSNGQPNQRFLLSYPNLILRSLGAAPQGHQDITLLSELGAVIQPWNLQESLAFSREEQLDYTIEIDEDDQSALVFGDGIFGAIPPAGAVIKVEYRVGGGLQGNVPAKSLTTIVDAPALALTGAKVNNPAAATGGSDRESISRAVQHAPKVFRSLKRAVTAEDYEALALDYNGVGKVRAEAAGWNTVTLFVAPQGGGKVSDLLKANLLTYFEDKRPLSTLVEIEDVDYVTIYVTAKIDVKSYYSQADVSEKVMQAAGRLLAFDNVDFADNIYLSKFYEAIEAIEGVEYVTISEFRRDGTPNTDDDAGKIVLRVNEIPRAPTESKYANSIFVDATGGY